MGTFVLTICVPCTRQTGDTSRVQSTRRLSQPSRIRRAGIKSEKPSLCITRGGAWVAINQTLIWPVPLFTSKLKTPSLRFARFGCSSKTCASRNGPLRCSSRRESAPTFRMAFDVRRSMLDVSGSWKASASFRLPVASQYGSATRRRFPTGRHVCQFQSAVMPAQSESAHCPPPLDLTTVL